MISGITLVVHILTALLAPPAPPALRAPPVLPALLALRALPALRDPLVLLAPPILYYMRNPALLGRVTLRPPVCRTGCKIHGSGQ